MATIRADDGVYLSYRVEGDVPPTALLAQRGMSGAQFDDIIEMMDPPGLRFIL
jgi:hypothetical protein